MNVPAGSDTDTARPCWPLSQNTAVACHFHGRARTCDARTVGAMASGGSGSRISTLLAEERSLNCERALTRYSVRLRLCFSTMHSTQISGRTFWFSRYVLPGL